ncbi:hypothetical protein J5N97_010124 [Dioscorea zingiberensis]|uniref:non-specific serine/threonine protein kinase n=1 Tax=Dioscorea zingiberensis TaxID=325984 RepID=A0A9D5CZI2_9LILI|nr:hypothetical protein J5N97_010124 [Dioscorea zingiberensis]
MNMLSCEKSIKTPSKAVESSVHVGCKPFMTSLTERFFKTRVAFQSNQMASLLLRIVILWVLLVRLTTFAADFEFIFNGFRGANLSLGGITNLADDGLLRLTNETQQSKGQAFNPSPLRLKTSRSDAATSFSTTFVFAIVSQYPTVSSYGFTFCLSPTKSLAGGTANFLGLFNSTNNNLSSNHIVGIEFDTIQTPEFKDIDDNHVGIDIHGLTSINSHTAGYYTGETSRDFRNLSLISGQPMQAWVDYDSKTLQLNVTLAPFQVPKPNRPLLSSEIDLSSIILEDMYVGFTASEGNILTTHYILGWSFKIDGNAPALDLTNLPSLPRITPNNEKHKAWKIWLSVSAASLMLLTAGLIMMYVVARRNKFEELREEWEQEYGPHRFSYKELFQATDGFKDKHFLGFGGFGSVYKGILPTSIVEIAVKRISHESRQGIREFVAEIVSLGRLRHRNLVRLLGYCRPPELARRGKATTSTDVYAFGVFLLEVACGKRPIEAEESGEELVLVDWVLECWKNGDIGAARDRRLGEEYVLEEMELVLKLGLLCCHPMATARPSMRQAMQFLNGDFSLPELSPSSLNVDVLVSLADEGFHNYFLSCPSSVATASVLSGGR